MLVLLLLVLQGQARNAEQNRFFFSIIWVKHSESLTVQCP